MNDRTAGRAPVKRWAPRLAGAAVMLGLLILLVRSEAGIGITFDEPVHLTVAQRNGGWLAEWRPDRLQGDWLRPFRREVLDRYWHNEGPTQIDRDLQPTFIKWLYLLSAGLFGWAGAWLPFHRLPAMLCWSLAAAVTAVLLARRWGWAAGVGGALGMAWLPRAFGHAHLLALDATVAALNWLTVLLVWHWEAGIGDRGSGTSKSGLIWRQVVVGLVWGCALATKLNAVLVPPAIILWLLLRRRWREAVSWGLVLTGVGLATFFLLWPWLWYDTFAHLREYLAYHTRHYPVKVWYFGRLYDYAPWHYAPVMTLITTPLPFLLLAVWGAWQGARRGRRERAFVLLCCLCVLAHWAPFLSPTNPKYNGVRLFLSALPPLGGLAAVGIRRLGIWLSLSLRRQPNLRRYLRGPRRAAWTPALLILLTQGVALWTHHPFYLSYYGELIGGLPGAVRRGLEATYWGDTYLQTLPYLNRTAAPGATVLVWPPGMESVLRIYQGGPLRRDLRLTGDRRSLDRANFIVFQNRPPELRGSGLEPYLEGPSPAFAATLRGVPLVFVFRGPGVDSGAERSKSQGTGRASSPGSGCRRFQTTVGEASTRSSALNPAVFVERKALSTSQSSRDHP